MPFEAPVPDVAISAEGLGKSFLIGHQAARAQDSFREMMARRARALGRSALDVLRGRPLVAGDAVEQFWALRDVSFEVRRGEVLGVIGRNGAGKSTLLKVLSRITEPSEGRAVIRGRVASLLEVGTGFHPELSGRENIYLNGAILGMTRAEIAARFDEIVAFAEVERFLDTPVKRYSSGMYMRLAFAVAAHLEPEILIIDEVLAVGDLAFQRKCLGKMQDVAQHGRTVIFVSHNLPSVVDLCDRAILLDRGRVAMAGSSHEVAAHFLASLRTQLSAGDISAYRHPYRDEGWVDIRAVSVCGDELGGAVVEPGDAVAIDVELAVLRPVTDGIVVVNILDERLEIVATFMSSDDGHYFSVGPGAHRVTCELGPLPLSPGAYLVNVGVAATGGRLAWDAVKALPGFRMGGEQSAAWLRWPERPGVVFLDKSRWR
ncbi:MAG TPA: ABC transporter ATP-binding protein [Stellaceae bacterium]|jgi:lipopolysaccharide transport system ATP-binding protein|nr:ABC transporter ATP-binding protein [Stellaceae bacterium]